MKKKIYKTYNYELLPLSINKKLDLLFSSYRDYRSKNNILNIVGLTCFKQMSDDSFMYSFIPLSVAYWRKVIGSHYSKYLKELISHEILESGCVFYTSDGSNLSKVMGYRIKPELLLEKFSEKKYFGSQSESQSANEISNVQEGNIPLTKIDINPESITIEKRNAFAWIASGLPKVVASYKNTDFIDGLPGTLSVLVRVLKDDGSFHSFYASVESALKQAGEQGKKLLYYKEKFIIADEAILNLVALQNLVSRYNWEVKSFLPEKFNFSRNHKTLRVYSKLSSMPAALLPFIKINGRYIMQADLKCSQFVIFGNLLNFYLNHSGDELLKLFKKKPAKTFIKNLVSIFDDHRNAFPEEGLNPQNPYEDPYISNDIYKFLEDTLVHDFYKIISSELGLKQRQHGKGIAFRTVFSKPKPENELVRQFRHLYPSVISIINDFKTKFEYNNFAIGLQCLEAELFIDHIWQKVKKKGIDSFTRHDSIVFPVTFEDDVKAIIHDVFSEFDFIYKIEYEVFNQEEIEQRLLDSTNYLDTVGDFDEFFLPANAEAVKDIQWQLPIDQIQEQLEFIELPSVNKDDYFNDVNVDTLICIESLEGLNPELKKCVVEDIANLQSNYPVQFFQKKTNNLIRWLVQNTNW